MTLERITDRTDKHAAEHPDCRACDGTGFVCEAHPNRPWAGMSDIGCLCGECGMPCPLIDGEQVDQAPIIHVVPLDNDGRPCGETILLHGTVTFVAKADA